MQITRISYGCWSCWNWSGGWSNKADPPDQNSRPPVRRWCSSTGGLNPQAPNPPGNSNTGHEAKNFHWNSNDRRPILLKENQLNTFSLDAQNISLIELLCWTGFPRLLESPGFFSWKFQDLESPGKSLWSWKVLEKYPWKSCIFLNCFYNHCMYIETICK